MSESNITKSNEEFLKAISDTPEKESSNENENFKDSEESFNELLGIENQDKSPTPEKEKDPKEKDPKEDNIQTEEQTTLKRFGVRDTIRSLVENDIWEDVALKIGDKEYENIEELLKSEKPSQELFDSLSQAQKQLRDTKLKENYISIKDKDSTKVKLINAILSDTDYQDLLQYNKDVVQPVQRLDFSNQADPKVREYTIGFVKQCLVDIEGIPTKYLDSEIKDLEADFRLIEKAESFQEQVIQNYQNEIDRRTEEVETLKKKKQEETKLKITDLRKVYKEEGFNDTFISKAIDLGFKEDENGNNHYINLIKERFNESPIFQSKLLHFLLDEKDFISKIKAPSKKETERTTLEIIQILPKESKGSKASKKPSNSISEADEEFLDAISKK